MKNLKFNTNASKRLTLAVVLAASAVFVSSTSASAQILVGVQFAPTGSTGYTGVGELGESFTEFNGPTDVNYPNNSYAGSTQMIGSGVSLTVAPTATTGGADNYFSGPGSASNFFENFLAGHNSGFTFTLAGLTAGNAYNVAVYSSDLGNRAGDNPVAFTINGTALPYNVGPANGGGTFIQQTASTAGNYEILNNVVANSSGDIVIGAADAGTGSYIEVNGLGLESVATPEPSTWALLLAGVGAAFGIQVLRRRSNA